VNTDWRALYPFESHWLPVGAHRVHYVDEGPRDAAGTVLMVHGNPTWSFYWRRYIEDLRGTFRVVAIDHLGCGLSDKPEEGPYRLADHIARLEALVVSLDLKNVTLLLHDWGGAIGMGMAARQPSRIARIGVFNTAAFPSPRMPFRIAVCRLPGIGPLAVRGFNGFAGAAIHMATEKGLSPAVRAGLLAPYDSWANRVAVQRFVEDIPLKAAHPSWSTLLEVEQGLAQFADHPVLIGWGDKDWCFTHTFRQDWERRFPGALVVRYADAGHYVLEDAAEALLPIVHAFAAGESDTAACSKPAPVKPKRRAAVGLDEPSVPAAPAPDSPPPEPP
jgi:pimeloyl-ACP methyl ester carboxylesterase